jgi:hypothetical protein
MWVYLISDGYLFIVCEESELIRILFFVNLKSLHLFLLIFDMVVVWIFAKCLWSFCLFGNVFLLLHFLLTSKYATIFYLLFG